MRSAASQYLEGGPLIWMLPLYLHVNQKFIDDDDDDDKIPNTILLIKICRKNQIVTNKKCHVQLLKDYKGELL